MPAGQLPPNTPIQPGVVAKGTGGCLTLGATGCMFLPTLGLASLTLGSRCPIVWIAGGSAGILMLLMVWPIAGLILFIADLFYHPSGKGAGQDMASAFTPFAASKLAATMEYGTPQPGGDIQTNDPDVFRGVDVETIRNRRVRYGTLLGIGLAIAIPLVGFLGRTNVDASGLPISATPANLLARPEVQLVAPGAKEYGQVVDSSMCTANADVYTQFGTAAAPAAVASWYDKSLKAMGWKPGGSSAETNMADVIGQYSRGTREQLDLLINKGTDTLGFDTQGQTFTPPVGTNTVYQVHYHLGPAP